MKCLEKCERVLTGLGLPYDFERFECGAAQLPDTYVVYFIVDCPGVGWADGVERSREPRVQVSLYYREKAQALTVPEQIEEAFAAAGFARVGSGTLPYQADTRHYGWRCDFRFYERRDNNG